MLSPELQALTEIRGVIYGLPESDRSAVEHAADEIREILAGTGDHGTLALALVGAEAAAAAS